jgi:CDP-6-deoxy-D-xylo-4-hexulose-3-dehydrase
VIVPAVTWPTMVAPVLQMGCVPVLIDVDRTTLNMRTDLLGDAVSPRTRAIFCVHLLGNPMEMGPVLDVAKAHDLWVLEDACEALGSTVDGRHVGSFGDFGTFSFYFSHHITTIEGGMLVTDDDQLADLARSMRAHGWTRDMSGRAELEAANPRIDPRFLFVTAGYNLRPTELQAAFGLVQLPRLEHFNEIRRANARYLLEALADLGGELEFLTEREGARSTWFGFAVLVKDPDVRHELTAHLEERGIETRPIIAGNLAAQPAFREGPHRVVGSLGAANDVGERGLFIGNHPALSHAHLDHIIGAFREYFFG